MNEKKSVMDIVKGKIVLNKKSKDDIKIIVSGDFCPINRIESECLKGNYKQIYDDILPVLLDNDISITNLECPLTLSNNPIKKTGPNFKANPKCIDAIKFGGFNIVTLANNHILDQGKDGLIDTINICNKYNVKTVGAGGNLDNASEILYLRKKGKKIAILNFTEHEFSFAKKNTAGANPISIIQNYYQIKEAKKNSDYIVIIVHGGNEHYPLPSPRLKQVFHYFIDIGANIVIGHHTHCSSGIEIYKGSPLVYSLGNFLFDWPNEKFLPWFEGFLLNISISQKGISEIGFIPYFQCKGKPYITLMKGSEKDLFLNKIKTYSEIISNDNYLELEWDKFSRNKKINYLSILFNLNKFQRFLLKKKRIPIYTDRLLKILNVLRCEAHNELAIKILENEILKLDQKC